ncbi:DUF308 domain-containing protein [Eubacteriales bacterium OttesenSCG-928-A19]|nr:DUF308 domain-containing protein [Eubacteriales bacterium OttesenSCG-928-A19]
MKRSSLGWVEIILGVLMVVLGIYTFVNPDTALVAIVIAYAIVAIVTGIADFVVYYRLERRGGFGSAMMIISGILNVLVGILLLFNIGAGAWTLSILFPVWFIIHCIARLANLDFVKRFGSRFEYWVSLIANVLGIIFGILLLFNPFAGAISLVYFVAGYLLVEGIASLVAGFGNVGARA